jgi:hypothetical protein
MEGVFEAISFVGIIFQSLHIRVPTIGFLLGLSLDMFRVVQYLPFGFTFLWRSEN